MQKQYVKAIDAIRVISILSVLLIHTTTRTIEATHNNLTNFPFTLFLNQIARFAVPIFILISGFVLELNYTKETTYFEFIKKRLTKILFPYIFWSLIYYFFIYTQNKESILRVILTGDASYQLYFIPTLAIFYTIFPILHRLFKLISNKYVLITLSLIQIAILAFDYYTGGIKLPDPIKYSLLSFFFFITGMVSARYKDTILQKIKKLKYIFLSISIILAIYIFLEGKIGFQISQSYTTFYSQWRPSVLFYTISIFPLLLYIFNKEKRNPSILAKLSKHSFFVFFIHVIVLEAVWTTFAKNIFQTLQQNSIGKIVFDPIFFITVTIISFSISYILHKIGKLHKLTG